MKKFTLNSLFLTAIFCLCALFVSQLSAQTTITSGTVYTTGTSFSVPSGYKVVKVEAWGGGGGGERNSNICGDGGGGGGYACINLDGSLVGPVTFSVTIGGGGSGASGENSLGCPGGTTTVSYGGTWMVQATGGRGGGHTGTYSCGGDASYYGRAGGTGSVNTAFSGYSSHVTNNGGSGGSGTRSVGMRAGGGGGAAGSASGVGDSGDDGFTNAVNATGGDGGTGTDGAGSGGRGGDNGFADSGGDNGAAPGGGGGGCPNIGLFTAKYPGSGAVGGVRFTLAAACDATPGAISAGIWVCSASPSDTSCIISSTTDASSSVGGTYQWQSSPDHSTWTTIPNTNSKQYTATATGYYRRGYAVSGCTTVYTNYVQVTRPSDIDPGTLKDGDNKIEKEVCAGGSVNVTLSKTYSGNVQWQTSTDKVNWTDVSTTSTYTISVTSATTTTYVRYIANYTPTCGIPSNNFYTLNVWEKPEVTGITAPTDKCPNKSSYELTGVVTPGSSSTLTYHWGGDADATVTTNPGRIIPTTTPNCNTPYSYSLYVTDGNGCQSNTVTVNDGFTTENPAWNLGTISSVTAVSDGSCHFAVPALTTLTDTLNKALTSTCGNAAVLSNLSLNAGDPITATTPVTATATDMCGVGHNVEITVVKPDLPTVNITTAEQYLCPGETTKLTTNVTAEEPTYEWTPASLGDKDTTRTIAYTGEDVNVHPDTFKVKVTDKYGCEAKGEIVIYTTPKAYIADQEHTVCTPKSVTFAAATGDKIPAASTTIGTNTFTSTTTYSWTIASNTGVTGASAATDQANFTTGTLTNGELTTQTVIYSVTPTTVTSFSGSEVTSCDGDAFTVTVNVKPTITTTGAIDPFDDADVIITLWYGACDTLYYVNAPAYTNNTDLTDVLSNNKATVNEGTTLLGRIAPGEYTIIWTVTDECGNHVDFPKKYIVRYPNCGDADPNYTEPYYAVDADNNVYHTVRIGCECWTASNLKTVTGAPNSMVYKCNDYPNETENEEKYGRLYTWYTAVNVAEGDNTTEPTVTTAAYSTYPYVHGLCPEGWAIPSSDNFTSMVNIAGGVNAVKSSSNLYWLPGAEGNDASGFGARGAGYYDSSAERFMNLMGETYFWTYETSSSYGGKCAVISYYCPELLIQDKLKGMGYSIRCIRRENP